VIAIGQVLSGKYRLLRLLGDGGMGAVYEATHEGLGTRVAIKVLHADLARRMGLVDRFLQEARVSAQIQSPHVVRVMDVERTADGVAYIVMELLEGEPLSTMLDRQGKVAIPVACDYTAQILSALEAAHALGVVHRDLKPENVFVTFAAARPVLKLIDFGIAKLKATDPGQKNLTVAGVLMGTAEYMAPEQAYSADRVDARSDLYAVGVMLFEMIAGQRPVAGDDARVIALKVERGEVTPLVHVAPEVPRELAGLVHRAMAARPELRFASATEMRLALEGAMTGRRIPTVQLRAPAAGGGGGGGGGGGAAGTGTMQGAPAAEILSAGAAGAGGRAREAVAGSRVSTSVDRRIDTSPPTTERAPGPPLMAMPHGAPAGFAPSPGLPSIPGYEASRGRRRRGAPIWLLVLLPLLVGAVVVVVLVMNADHDAAPVVTPAPTPTVALTPSITPAPTVPGNAPDESMPALIPATRSTTPAPLPKPASTTGPRPASDAASAVDAGPGETRPPPFTFPTALPSGFPTFPGMTQADGGVSVPSFPFPIPSGFPTTFPFPMPGAAPAPADPQPAPTASGRAL
jgi:predicted Ser/Thr protein kinase